MIENYMALSEPDEPKTCLVCELCRESIYEWQDYYEMPGCIICEECLHDWARQYKKIAVFDG